MAEEANEAPKKKKKLIKLPILMAIVILFIGGGFYALTSAKGGHGRKQVPKIELAGKDTDLEEFLTNTANPSVYVRAKISIRLTKEYDEAKLKENMGDIRDAALLVFNATAPTDISDASKRKDLKKRLADAINEAIRSTVPKPPEPTPGQLRKGGARPLAPVKPIVPPDCDSDTGPVMKIRFNALATQ